MKKLPKDMSGTSEGKVFPVLFMKKSLTVTNIKSIDKSDMLGILLDFPQQCLAAYRIAQNCSLQFQKRNFSKIVFSGMGGSSTGAEVVKSYAYFESKLPISILKEYELPGYVDDSTLVFILSYSGNTEETLSVYKYAKERGASIIALSSGGALKQDCQRDSATFVELPGGLPSRCALAYLSIIPLCLLARLGLTGDISSSLDETVNILRNLRDKSLKPNIGQKDNPAKYAASRLLNKFAVIYSASIHFEAVAWHLRNQLNENAKALASSHVLPEMNHNEIVGWQNPRRLFKNFVVVMFQDKHMHPRVSRRIDLTLEILRKEGVEAIEVWSRGEGILSRIFSLLYIGDFISFYLAVLYGVDPTPVDRITYLKKRLSRRSTMKLRGLKARGFLERNT